VREAAQDVQGGSQDCGRGIVRLKEKDDVLLRRTWAVRVTVGSKKCCDCLYRSRCRATFLFIFAWPFAYIFLLICLPAWKGGRAFTGSAFALLFWSECRVVVHHGGLERYTVYRIYDFTVRSKSVCV
jgi:hypothetical protein